jgi:hypothetical protein
VSIGIILQSRDPDPFLQSWNPGIAWLQSRDFRECRIPNYSIIIYTLLHKLKFHTNWRFRSPHSTADAACRVWRVWQACPAGKLHDRDVRSFGPVSVTNSWQLVHVAHLLPTPWGVLLRYPARTCVRIHNFVDGVVALHLHKVALAMYRPIDGRRLYSSGRCRSR